MQLFFLIYASSSINNFSWIFISAILILIQSIYLFCSGVSGFFNFFISVLSLRFLLIHSFSSEISSLIFYFSESRKRFSQVSFSLRLLSSFMIYRFFSLCSFFQNYSKLSLRANCFSSPPYYQKSRFQNSSKQGFSFSFSSFTLTAYYTSEGTRLDYLGLVATRCEILRCLGWMTKVSFFLFYDCLDSSTALVERIETLLGLTLVLSGVVLLSFLSCLGQLLSKECQSFTSTSSVWYFWYLMRFIRKRIWWQTSRLVMLMRRGSLLLLQLSSWNFTATMRTDRFLINKVCLSTSAADSSKLWSVSSSMGQFFSKFLTIQSILLRWTRKKTSGVCLSRIEIYSAKSRSPRGLLSHRQASSRPLPPECSSLTTAQLQSKCESQNLSSLSRSRSNSTPPAFTNSSPRSPPSPRLPASSKAQNAPNKTSRILQSEEPAAFSSRQTLQRRPPSRGGRGVRGGRRWREVSVNLRGGWSCEWWWSWMGLNLPVSRKCSSVWRGCRAIILLMLQHHPPNNLSNSDPPTPFSPPCRGSDDRMGHRLFIIHPLQWRWEMSSKEIKWVLFRSMFDPSLLDTCSPSSDQLIEPSPFSIGSII